MCDALPKADRAAHRGRNHGDRRHPPRRNPPGRRSGPLTGVTTAQIRALSVDQLEALAVGAAFSEGVALLDFTGPADLAAWLAANA
ncbi:MAG: DUF4351 domain-containing protein [Cyanobacteriota bacterium]